MNLDRSSMSTVAYVLAAVVVISGFVLWNHPWKTEQVQKKSGGNVAVKVNDDLASQGKQLANSNGCTSCHSTTGASGAGPTWQGLWGSQGQAISGKTVDAAYVSSILTTPPAAMASFKGKFSPAQQKAIAEYIKSLAQ